MSGKAIHRTSIDACASTSNNLLFFAILYSDNDNCELLNDNDIIVI